MIKCEAGYDNDNGVCKPCPENCEECVSDRMRHRMY